MLDPNTAAAGSRSIAAPHQSDPEPVGLTRHEAAVRRTLDLADEAAARGDFDDALAWLAAIEAMGDDLPAEYVGQQRAWRLTGPQQLQLTARTAPPGQPADGTVVLTCPRCALTLEPRPRWLTVRHCPRCVARHHVTVDLISSTTTATGESAD